jgi:SpoVK/Ycf46/Vps4 family AAA+-type ATPase
MDAVEALSWRAMATPFARAQTRWDLSPIEVDALWLLSCCELEPQLGRLLASIGGTDDRGISVSTMQSLLELVAGDATGMELLARLDEKGLVETTCAPEIPTYLRPIRANDRVLQLARGILVLDHEVSRFALVCDPDEIAARRIALPDSLLAAFDQNATITAFGSPGSGRRTFLATLAARRAKGTLQVRVSALATEPRMLERQLRAVVRESGLFDAIPMFVGLDASPTVQASLERVFGRADRPILATSTTAIVINGRSNVAHSIAPPSISERRQIWSSALPGCSDSTVTTIAEAYVVSPATITAASRSALAGANGDASQVSVEDVHASLRANVDQRLSTVATRITVTQTWNDLVLPTDQFDQLIELVARIQRRSEVLDEWGFADKVGRGTGVAALLSGPPGTGKTMVAGLIARELGLDLYQVDISKVVSKYIGETEKNLSVIFDAAESGHAVLLFDEADSLFAKRSEVKSSNDRYANQEVNYLLQRIEQFRGISLLTTNHDNSLDEALRRRLSLHIRFPTPDEDQRAQLWRVMIPSRAPLADDIDFDNLAKRFEMTGGYIKNAAVRAAYLASHERSRIGMNHLVRAARAEYEAMGKIAHQGV